jgi:hypothetical protein
MLTYLLYLRNKILVRKEGLPSGKQRIKGGAKVIFSPTLALRKRALYFTNLDWFRLADFCGFSRMYLS